MEINRNRAIGVALALLLGEFGIHKFYVNKPWQGLLYILFSWTFIPFILGIIEGLIWLFMSDAEWQQKYGKDVVIKV